ncbi:MAG: argininosuccinate lyase [Clostridia bacterium]|nr:argininosuccinate lyase [Clostridia bacterium]
MAKMWAGRTDGQLNKDADDFNSSISFDSKMFKQDITGSMAHAQMLATCGIITLDDADKIIAGLEGILNDLISGDLQISPEAEDIHMFVEEQLIARIGDTGKKLHTARSRNDQVALDLRMYLKDQCKTISELLVELLNVLVKKADEYKYTVMPGYTHLQRAQPIVFAQHLLCYAQMFKRDYLRLNDAVDRMNYSPLGSCALAGTTYATNRKFVADKLGFNGVTENSMDGVSDRDFCIELLSCFSIIMMHLSRFCEEIILWTSWEFKFVELSDEFTTGSSIMPQKKNSDMAELIRGKTGRVYGDLFTLLTVLKGLPLAYNKDMQEDKEAIFDGLETVIKCLKVFNPMLDGMKVLKENMYSAAQKGFINATDLADYLTKKGVPFRTAYKAVGSIVAKCVKENKVLEDLSLAEFKEFNQEFEQDLYEEISLETCVNKRVSEGGTSPDSVQKQIELLKEFLLGIC